MICQSCSKQKHKLHHTNAKLMRGLKLYLCTDCKTKGYEPRWLVIIAARTKGLDPITRKFLADHRYIGQEIKADEIV